MIQPGTPLFWRTNLALFAAGLATFALLYVVQPLMKPFADAFHVSPAVSSLTLSVTTFPLAIAMLGASLLADRVGRKNVMVASLLASAIACAACAVSPGLPALLGLRALMGITLAGLPSLSMTYISEEMAPASAGLAMGLFIGGSALGGMSGRLLSGLIAAHAGWRASLAAIGVFGGLCGAALARFLPPGQHAPTRDAAGRMRWDHFAVHLRQPTQRRLFGLGFLLMGSFVTLYNYITFRLLAPPFALTQLQVSWIFATYLVGVVSSATMGQAVLRFGRRKVLVGNIFVMLIGLASTLFANLEAAIAGIALFTAGFFGAHSVASTWVGAAARQNRAQASALYLLAYYVGGSLAGTAAGWIWASQGWAGVATLLAAILLAASVLAGGLPRRG